MTHFGTLWQPPWPDGPPTHPVYVYRFFEKSPDSGKRYWVTNFDATQPLPFVPLTPDTVVACELVCKGDNVYADASTMRLATSAPSYVRGRIVGWSYI